MRVLSSFGLLLSFMPGLFAQLGGRTLYLEEIAIPNVPAVHSFAWAEHNGEWLVLGGRTDGLHQRQPFAAFLAADNNTTAHVVDPVNGQVWSAPLSGLPAAQYEQLQSTNMEFLQRDTVLYMIGGYGFSSTANDHITHAAITAANVPALIAAIKANAPLSAHFRSLNDARMAVTGGGVLLKDDFFHLVGGQRFIGRYNPMGPGFGPGFVQEYTNAIRRFRVNDDGLNLSIAGYTEVVDTNHLHRRDYNLVPQVLADGTDAFTAFSGVFQYGNNIPWLNVVDIVDSTYTVVPGFEQLLNHYHSAHAPLFDSVSNTMSTVFFGGIAQFYFDGNGVLFDDPNVPFVNTISVVERDAANVRTEMAIGEMPALLGAGAEFIPLASIPHTASGIIRLDQLAGDTVLIGHVLGGIESSAANIFFVNTGTQSAASTRVFRVFLIDMGTGIAGTEAPAPLMNVLAPLGAAHWTVRLDLPESDTVVLRLLDTHGRMVRNLLEARLPAGKQEMHVPVGDLATGGYIVELITSRTRHGVPCMK